MRSDKKKAIKLRLSGKSYNQIREILNIPKSTLSTWLKDIKLSKQAQFKIESRVNKLSIYKLIKRNKEQTIIAKANHQKIRVEAIIEANELLREPLFITGTSLYWAEGYKKGWEKSKWKSIDFANSDPEMIKIMLLFFNKYLKIEKKDIKIQIMGYERDDIEKYKSFWHNLTSVPKENFFRPHLTLSKSSKKKVTTKLKYGTIHLRINNVNAFFRLSGWIDALKTKFN